MGNLPKFVGVFVLALLALSGSSIVWPYLTRQPRPAPLEQLHALVGQTSVGHNIENVLGLTSGEPVEPINMQQAGTALAGSVVTAVESKAQSIVVKEAVKQVVAQFDKLPDDQKEEIKASICQPVAP